MSDISYPNNEWEQTEDILKLYSSFRANKNTGYNSVMVFIAAGNDATPIYGFINIYVINALKKIAAECPQIVKHSNQLGGRSLQNI